MDVTDGQTSAKNCYPSEKSKLWQIKIWSSTKNYQLKIFSRNRFGEMTSASPQRGPNGTQL